MGRKLGRVEVMGILVGRVGLLSLGLHRVGAINIMVLLVRPQGILVGHWEAEGINMEDINMEDINMGDKDINMDINMDSNMVMVNSDPHRPIHLQRLFLQIRSLWVVVGRRLKVIQVQLNLNLEDMHRLRSLVVLLLSLVRDREMMAFRSLEVVHHPFPVVEIGHHSLRVIHLSLVDLPLSLVDLPLSLVDMMLRLDPLHMVVDTMLLQDLRMVVVTMCRLDLLQDSLVVLAILKQAELTRSAGSLQLIRMEVRCRPNSLVIIVILLIRMGVAVKGGKC